MWLMTISNKQYFQKERRSITHVRSNPITICLSYVCLSKRFAISTFNTIRLLYVE